MVDPITSALAKSLAHNETGGGTPSKLTGISRISDAALRSRWVRVRCPGFSQVRRTRVDGLCSERSQETSDDLWISGMVTATRRS